MSSKLLSFEGRVGRRYFWFGFIAFFLTEYLLVLLIAFCFIVGGGEDTVATHAALLKFAVLSLSVCWLLPIAFSPVWAKRWHDLDQSGNRSFIVLIPGAGLLATMIICGFFRGTTGPNRFGPDPLA